MAVERRSPLAGTGVAFGLAIAGIILSVLVSFPALLFEASPLPQFVAAVVLSELGFAIVAAGFLAITGLGWRYLDLALPSGRVLLAWGVGGALALLLLRQAVLTLVLLFDVPIAGNSITEFPGLALPTILLVLVPLSVLVIGPAEELLFRGVIQKYLYGSFSRRGAIAVSSLAFAAVHAPTAYVATPDPAAVLVTLASIFLISFGLGWLYARTDSLVVPIVAHGLYDAFAFAIAYVLLRFGNVPLT